MKCDNCVVKPVYVVENRGAKVQYFCERHLPLFLRDKSRKPFLTRWSDDYEPVKEEKAVAKKPAKKKAKSKAVVKEEVQAVAEDVAVAEEAVVEAVAVEEVEVVVEEVNESNRENSDETGSSDPE